MNPPHRSSSVHRSAVPGYRKWYFGAGGSPGRRGMEAAPEPDPLPFEEIHEHAEITVGPPSTSIIAAYKQEAYAKFGEENYADASRQAVKDMIEDISGALSGQK